MSKSAFVLGFFLHAMANQPAIADEKPSSNALKPITTLEEVCSINKKTGYFKHEGFTYTYDEVRYSKHCGRLSHTRTDATHRSSLEITAHSNDKQRWEDVTLTLNVDDQKEDIHANAAFREASYRLLGGQAQTDDDKAKVFAMAYGEDYFESIAHGDYNNGLKFLKGYCVNINHEYNRMGGSKVILHLTRL